jgi:hypothetical protein
MLLITNHSFAVPEKIAIPNVSISARIKKNMIECEKK